VRRKRNHALRLSGLIPAYTSTQVVIPAGRAKRGLAGIQMPWMAILDIYMPFGRHKYTFSRVFYIHVAWIPANPRFALPAGMTLLLFV